VLHRDLKPSNVLLQVRPYGKPSPPTGPDPLAGAESAERSGLAELIPRLTDFGLAKFLDQADELTLSGFALGSPPYMAPEQAEGRSRELGPPTDVYALGAILYRILCEQPPFQGETPRATLHQVLECEPVPPRHLRPDVPRDLERICLRCLEKEPARRYPDAAALAEDLARFLELELAPASRTPHQRPKAGPTKTRLVRILALVLIAVLIAGAWYAARSRRISLPSVDDPASTALKPLAPPKITTPDFHVVATKLASIAGTVRVGRGHPAIAQLKLQIVRKSDGRFWNPAAGWVLATTTFPARLDSTTGSWDTTGVTMPGGANLINGQYLLQTIAFDTAGHPVESAETITVNSAATDTTPPLPATFRAPARGAIVAGLPRLSGTAQDNLGGSGITSVQLLIHRVGDGRYWSGSTALGWSTRTARFAATLDADGHWSAPAGALPSGVNLPDGAYRVWAYTSDKAGNRRDTSSTFTVRSRPGNQHE
jgi:hypothetical protein